MLASILAHEEWHLSHGGDERGAYLQQQTTLQYLGLDLFSTEVSVVRQSMEAVRRRLDRIARVTAALATAARPQALEASAVVSASMLEARANNSRPGQ